LVGPEASAQGTADGSGYSSLSHGSAASSSGSSADGSGASADGSGSSGGGSGSSAGTEPLDVNRLWLPAVLMMCAAHWMQLRLAWRFIRFTLLPRTVLVHLESVWPKERLRVPVNVDFVIHRYNEFMMLMLGETVLQLVIADVPIDLFEHYASVIAGFVIVVTINHSYQMSEPHHADGHAMRRHALAGITQGFLMVYRAAATLLVGVAIKLVLYSPVVVDTGTPRAWRHRWLFGGALVAVTVIEMLMTPLHAGFVAHFVAVAGRADRATVFALRLVGVGAMLALCALPLQPWVLTICEAGCAVVQWVLLCCEVFLLGVPGRKHQHHDHHVDRVVERGEVSSRKISQAEDGLDDIEHLGLESVREEDAPKQTAETASVEIKSGLIASKV